MFQIYIYEVPPLSKIYGSMSGCHSWGLCQFIF